LNSEPKEAPTRSPYSLTDIAIIGMAGRFPEADSIHQFFENLCAGRDSIREISRERRARTSLALNEDFQICAYLDEIDTFDHTFFGISRREAQNMAPEQRLLLEIVYQAIENASYAPTMLKGLRASVYGGDSKLEYSQLARSFDPLMVMGNHTSATVGRISRFLGLRGTSAMIDSSCSSSLLALHLAINDLRLGDAELALVCGVNVELFPARKSDERDIGIKSPDGKTRCFSAEASGTGSGEAVACIVLKRLDEALRDGDLVHAVVKGVAANHVAGRSSTLTAPDSTAQAEVIQHAWQKAGIDPTTISYIEAHGTATRLGDPIEIEGLDFAFGQITSQKHFCALSSVKSNVGHTWSAAGVVGLIKAVLSLKHRVLFPNLHCANLSPLIDFASSAVFINTELTAWEPSCGIRRAGVSSFGIMGTNVHAVLEEAPPRADACSPWSLAHTFLIPISARSGTSLELNIAALRQWIERFPSLSLADLQRTLVQGRDHYSHRFCATASDLQELSTALSDGMRKGIDSEVQDVTTVLLLSGQSDVSPECTLGLRRAQPYFDELYAQCEQVAGKGKDTTAARCFAFQYAFYGLLKHIGLSIRHVVGEGTGKHVLDASSGRLELAKAIHLAILESGSPVGDIEACVERLLQKLKMYDRVLFVEAGPLSSVSRAISVRTDTAHPVIHLSDCSDGFILYLRDLYCSGANWKWGMTAGEGHKIELPSYQFQRVRCWLEDVKTPSPAEVQPAAPPPDVPLSFDCIFERVTAIWTDILGCEGEFADTSFFSLGGDSISGTQLVNRIQTLFGIELEQDTIFKHETAVAMARLVEKAMRARNDVLASETSPVEEEHFPALPAQLHIWLAGQFEGGSAAFNLTRSLHFSDELVTHSLQQALNSVAGRHDALRCTFVFKEGKLLQRVARPNGFIVPLEERLIDLPVPDEQRLSEIVREFASQEFDLEQGPLLRAQLLRFRDNHHVLTYGTHHIVADGWSLDLLTRDLLAFYAHFARGGPLALHPLPAYRDCCNRRIAYQSGQNRATAAAYWLKQFEQEIPSLSLPVGSSSQNSTFRGMYRNYRLPDDLYERLKSFSQTHRGTIFLSLLSTIAVTLARYTERGELAVGTSLAGRDTTAVEELIGMFVQTLPLRLQIDMRDSFHCAFEHVRSVFAESLQHLHYSYEELVGELQQRGQLRASRLFDVLFESEQFAESASPFEGIPGAPQQMTPVEVSCETSILPLNIMFAREADDLKMHIRFDTGLFDVKAIDRFWEDFVSILGAALERPEDPLERLGLLSHGDPLHCHTIGHRILDFDPDFLPHNAIEKFAVLHPGRVCLSSSSGECTYSELNARANQITRFLLHDCELRQEEIVVLVIRRSMLLVQAILALWKCGCAYLPIDPDYPPSFMRTILELSQARVVVLDSSNVSPELREQIQGQCQVVLLDPATARDESSADLNLFITSSQLAYVIYTSGSTGMPKGVMVEHIGMLNHMHAKILDLSLSERSVIAHNASSSFDISVWQMFAALFVGGRTAIYDQALLFDPTRFAEQLERDGVTILEVVPSYLQTLLDAWDQPERRIMLDALKFLVITGEAASPQLVNRWLHKFPGKTVVNAYGPTEASDDITHHFITEKLEGNSVPLGRPIPNVSIYVLDQNDDLCPKGVKGEICVSGICVSRGYLNEPEQTARNFMPGLFQPEVRMYRTGDIGRWAWDGTLEYFGRKDSQVKVRGFRIELREIEAMLASHPGVRQAAVLVREDEPGQKQLVAYFVADTTYSPAGENGTREILSSERIAEWSATFDETHRRSGLIDDAAFDTVGWNSSYTGQPIRRWLMNKLPEYMVPATYIRMDRLPLTLNGKIDRLALERLEAPKSTAAATLRPNSPTESILIDIWQQVLGRSDFGADDRFFDLGGNSLRAIQVLSRIRAQLGIDLDIEVIFRQPTISALAERISIAQSCATDEIPRAGAAGTYDIGYSQSLLLRIEENYPSPDAFHRNDLYRVQSVQFDPGRLERSFAQLLQRHESLRTTYDKVLGKPVQVVHAPGSLSLPFTMHDFSHRSDALAWARRFLNRRMAKPFRVKAESLVRADLVRVSPDTFLLLISMHPLISDGRSADVLLKDLLELYQSPGSDASCQDLRLQYKDIALWRNRRFQPERHRDFWLAELHEASPSLPLSTDRARPAVSVFPGERMTWEFPEALSAAVRTLADTNGATEFVVAWYAVALLLVSETGLQDVTIGTYASARNRVDLEDQIGFHINTIPLRFRMRQHDNVSSMLARAQDDFLRAFQHQEYPYEWIMRDLGWSRPTNRPPLFDVMIAMDEADAEEKNAPVSCRLHMEREDIPRRAKEADLLFAFSRAGNRLSLVLTYNTELFSRSNIEKRAVALQGILESMVEMRPICLVEHKSLGVKHDGR
jgi:amino acid adenylation domain-containing protein